MKNIKKIIAAALVLVMMMAFTGCVSTNQASYTELTVSETEQNPDMASYTNDFDGIVSYLKDCEVIAGDGTDMSADFIGAVKGQKFNYTYNGQKISCEIYEYNTEKLSEGAQAVIDAVKADGMFVSLDTEVPAVLSDSGKFLMIYVNESDEDDQTAFTTRINEKFTSFVGTEAE